MIQRLLLLLLLVSVSACAYNPALPQGTGPQAERTPESPGEVAEVPSGAASAGAVLVAEGQAELAAGNTGKAAASIERALRIEPRNSRWWTELGNVRLAEGDVEQALALARKALRLAGSDSTARAAAEALIARADGR